MTTTEAMAASHEIITYFLTRLVEFEQDHDIAAEFSSKLAFMRAAFGYVSKNLRE